MTRTKRGGKTAKERVRAVFPKAFCGRPIQRGPHRIYIDVFSAEIGIGGTVADAWSDAASRLPKERRP